MLINSVNNINTNCSPIKPQSFSRTAVPYPEYNYAYANNQGNLFDVISNKLNEIFHPEVSQQAKNIKHQINTIFEEENKTGKVVNALA